VLPFGQAISRTTYANLFNNVLSTFYGTGDGSTTFNLPDLCGRVLAAADNMGGSAAGRLTSVSGMGTGALTQTGGGETQTLTLSQIPGGITSTGSNTITVISTSPANILSSSGPNDNWTSIGGTSTWSPHVRGSVTSSGTNTINATSNNTGGGAHPIVQPTIVCNYILRII
jgi:microcystin-dependent protein